MSTLRRAGRPKKSSGDPKSAFLDIRLEESEKEAFKDAASVSGLSLAAWVRQKLRTAAISDLETIGKRAAFLDKFIEGAK